MQTRSETLAMPAVPLAPAQDRPTGTEFGILGAISFSHLLNDMIQSLLLAIYPLLTKDFRLDLGQVGLITLAYQLTASLLQPLVGMVTDRKPMPYSLPIGMGCTLCGLLLLATAPNFPLLLLAASLVGTGSSVFHPESSRVARLASGGRHGLAQSVFQVGGNAGAALGPLLAAWLIEPRGRGSVAWFSLAALLAVLVLSQVSRWYAVRWRGRPKAQARPAMALNLTHGQVAGALAVLGLLVFSKYFYLASISSYYMFYLRQKFGISVPDAQVHLSLFLAAVAVGALVGGPIGDRIGRKYVIWASILGVAPFTLLLPHANLFWTGALTVVIGLILASAFSAILVYAQELIPGRVGMVSGLFFGFAFGMGGIGAWVLGRVAVTHGIDFVYQLCAYLPLIGMVTVLLPNLEPSARRLAKAAA